jgi:Heterokaryon incompatibility protein (HET)
VWGDPLNTKQILVNGQVREVTVSCWNVLHAHSCFLEYGENTPIWIDAICINQNDLREREQQVLCMHLIYAKGHCEAHLGDCTRDPFAPWDDRVAVKALKILAKLWNEREQ